MKKILLLAASAVLVLGAVLTGVSYECQAQTKKATTAVAKKGTVVNLTNDNLYRPSKKVKKLTILDFNATWCGPCKQFAPAFHEGAAKFGAKVDFVSVDTDNNPATAKAFGVQSIPTVIFIYPDGKTKRIVGTQDLLPSEKFFTMVQNAMK